VAKNDPPDPNGTTWMSHPQIPHTQDTPVQVTEAQLAYYEAEDRGWKRAQPTEEQIAAAAVADLQQASGAPEPATQTTTRRAARQGQEG
jgi:ketosteroid isomerase-like protein